MPKEIEFKHEAGILLYREKWRYKYSDDRVGRWEMATELRRPWWGYGNVHPDSVLTGNRDCSQNPDEIVCPYCNCKHEPWEVGYESQDLNCWDCGREFYVEADFGYGFSTQPKKCKHHDMLFESQYAHQSDNGQWSTWRNFKCKHCNHSIYDVHKESKQALYTRLPWLDEYDDPDFFDPEGVLNTGADLTEEYQTPILDFLREKRPWQGWYGAKTAIEKHEKIYGKLP